MVLVAGCHSFPPVMAAYWTAPLVTLRIGEGKKKSVQTNHFFPPRDSSWRKYKKHLHYYINICGITYGSEFKGHVVISNGLTMQTYAAAL